MAHPSDTPQRDIIIESGSTFTMTVHRDANLTGYAFAMKGRQSHGATTPLVFDLSSLNGDIVISVSGNHTDVTVTIAASATAAFTAPQYGVYDLEATSLGVTTRIAEGTYYITPNATR